MSPPRQREAVLRVGIDASNLRSGGLVTHISELLGHGDPRDHGIDRVILWASQRMLERIPVRPWLDRVHVGALDGPLPIRVAWQIFLRSGLARRAGCDVVFAPGGTPPGTFRPYVSMSVNMMPFDAEESARYGWSRDRLRLVLLKAQQSRAFRESDAVIFLTEVAREHISKLAGLREDARTLVIPSGVNDRFRSAPRPPRPLKDCTFERPFQLVYVSDVHPYKHHVNVVKAVQVLRQQGLPIALDLIGFKVHAPSAVSLQRLLASLGGEVAGIRNLGPLAHDLLPPIYKAADAFVFASTCENLPMTLVEAMASGLPVVASQTSPMPHILGPGHPVFDATDVSSIANAIQAMAMDPALQERSARTAHDASVHYSWDECAARTFTLLADVAARHRRS